MFLSFVLCAGLLTLLLSTVAFTILWRCKKLLFQIRFLSMNLMMTNLVFGIIVTCVVAAALVTGRFCTSLQRTLPMIFLTYQLIVTAIGVDRMMSIRFSFRYTFWHKPESAYILITCLYSIPVVLYVINNASDNLWDCGEGDMFTFTGLAAFSAVIMVIFILNIAVYVYIGVVALQKHRLRIGILRMKQNDFRQYWRITAKAFHLCVLTFLMLGPFVISRIIVLPYFERRREINGTPAFVLMLAYLHQLISPIFNLVTYRECRYQVQQVLSTCNKKKRDEIENEYKQHYASFDISIVQSSLKTRDGI